MTRARALLKRFLMCARFAALERAMRNFAKAASWDRIGLRYMQQALA